MSRGAKQGALHATIGRAGDMWRVVVNGAGDGSPEERLFERQFDAVVYFLKIGSPGEAQPCEPALNP